MNSILRCRFRPGFRGNHLNVLSGQLNQKYSATTPMTTEMIEDITLSMNIDTMIQNYQERGHLAADLDPTLYHRNFKLDPIRATKRVIPSELHLGDPTKSYPIPSTCYIKPPNSTGTVEEIAKLLQQAYCGTRTVEFGHIADPVKRAWLAQIYEEPGLFGKKLTKEVKLMTLETIAKATMFEQFIEAKWNFQKRFGADGLESLIPLMDALVEISASRSCQLVVIGIAHRGRLNVLSQVGSVKVSDLLNLFMDPLPDPLGGISDVKYHMGAFRNKVTYFGNKIAVCVLCNASHLEMVSPIVLGRVKGEMILRGDTQGTKVLGIVLHGDAALAGQGVAYETLNMAKIPGYDCQGVIHIAVNNQIGYTAKPTQSRGCEYCTELAKITEIPILHVNADDLEAVVNTAYHALSYRNKFKEDVMIDIVGYRRYGHNEGDDPRFTQPVLYKTIDAMKPSFAKYAEKLINDQVVTREYVEDLKKNIRAKFEKEYEEAKLKPHFVMAEWDDTEWGTKLKKIATDPTTGIENESTLAKILEVVTEPTDKIVLHEEVVQFLLNRLELIKNGQMDWSLAECLAIGSLLLEGNHIRLAGNDVQRGKVIIRHHVYHNQESPYNTYIPLCNLSKDQGLYTCHNGPINYLGSIGFERGYSITSEKFLNIWEPTHGAFVINGQIMIDQYVSSGEAKWWHMSGQVLSLPHGQSDPTGESFSAQPERFLMMCTDDSDIKGGPMAEELLKCNWIVTSITTPANWFHALRRQLKLEHRKPLVNFFPAPCADHPMMISSFDSIRSGTKFLPYIPDEQNPKDARRVLICTGKMYFDLIEARQQRKLESQVAIARMEQLYPFPYEAIINDISKRYAGKNVYWVQEEPWNQGWWTHVGIRLRTALRDIIPPNSRIRCLSPPASASRGTVIKTQQYSAMQSIMNRAFSI